MNDNAIVIPSDKVSIEKENTNKTLFGFWLYLMTDCVLFAALFACYAVLHGNTFGGPKGSDIFSMPYILAETLLLLTSSFTCGIAMLYARKNQKKIVLYALIATFILGLSFLTMELHEFRSLVIDGHSWRQSAFLSSYFTLVGTHGLHITIGLFWMVVVSYQIYKKGLKEFSIKRLALLSLFWHFLDIIWIFIFTVVYLMGVV